MLVVFALLMWVAPWLQAGSSPAPAGAMPIIENARARVWDLTWTRGRPGPVHRHEYDAVGVYVTASGVRTTIGSGGSAVSAVKPGDVVFWKKGTEHQEEG